MKVKSVLKVSSKTDPSTLAGAIASLIRGGEHVELQSIGAGALNQAVKAVAIARGYFIPSGIDLCFSPSFTNVNINGEEKTAIKMTVMEVD